MANITAVAKEKQETLAIILRVTEEEITWLGGNDFKCNRVYYQVTEDRRNGMTYLGEIGNNKVYRELN